MTPRTMALRYRIWAYASPRGWDCTLAEVADALGETIPTVNGISIRAGWASRFRVMTQDNEAGPDRVPTNGMIGVALARDIASGRVGVDA